MRGAISNQVAATPSPKKQKTDHLAHRFFRSLPLYHGEGESICTLFHKADQAVALHFRDDHSRNLHLGYQLITAFSSGLPESGKLLLNKALSYLSEHVGVIQLLCEGFPKMLA